MRKKIFIVSIFAVLLLVFGTSAFAAVQCELPSKLRAVWEVFTNPDISRPDNITVNLYGQTLTIIDFSYFEQHKDSIFWLIRAFYYPFLALFIYDNILLFLRGAKYTSPVSFGNHHNPIGFRPDKKD